MAGDGSLMCQGPSLGICTNLQVVLLDGVWREGGKETGKRRDTERERDTDVYVYIYVCVHIFYIDV